MTTRTSKTVVRFPVNPVPASRPRVTRFGTYYSKTYKAWLAAAMAAVAPCPYPPVFGHYEVLVESIVERPRTTKLSRPKGDVDNYAKGPLDVLTKLRYWPDDADITVLTSTKRFTNAGERPCTVVTITGPAT